ncbi:hypothetical protein O3P69_015539 [Scylla paramamosain]|uniref:Uncharacterized protein n=1 Tax=Scylla paramamosain TaxID=85552 RepID=A0AAW0SJN2_SCYPA
MMASAGCVTVLCSDISSQWNLWTWSPAMKIISGLSWKRMLSIRPSSHSHVLGSLSRALAGTENVFKFLTGTDQLKDRSRIGPGQIIRIEGCSNHEVRRLLLGSGTEADLHHLLEVFREEMGTEGVGLWEAVWTVLERAGLLRSRGEEVEVVVPSEWIRLAQGWFTWAVMGGGGQCEGNTLMVNLVDALAETLRRSGSGQATF